MATLTGELISETYDSLLKVTDNNTITGVKKRITDGFGNDIPLQLSSTDIEIDGVLLLSALTNLPSTPDKFLAIDATNKTGYRTASQVRTDIDAGTVNSVGLTMPNAFAVGNTPITDSGVLEVTAIGSASQYIRGDGVLATLPSSGSGGSSVNYYLNGSVNASVGGYKQMSNSAIIGTGTDFTLSGNGLIAQFLTDVSNPNRLLIPGGAWNFEMYFQVSSVGGNTKFYIELLKYDGVTFTSIANSSIVPEEITSGTTIDLYVTSIAVPQTVLSTTDRLAIRVYIVDNSGGRTVTLHTEDNTLCEIITTFAGGISALNGLTANTQYFATGTTGTDFAISSVTDTHTFNLPTASATNRGALSSADWTTFNNKQSALTNPVTGTGTSGYVPKFTGSSTIGNSLIYDNNTVVLIGATTSSGDIQTKLELINNGPVGLKIKSLAGNGNNTFLSIESSKEWRFVTNRGDLISGNQGDLIIRNNTDNINHIILNQSGATTFYGALTGTTATFNGSTININSDNTYVIPNRSSTTWDAATVYRTAGVNNWLTGLRGSVTGYTIRNLSTGVDAILVDYITNAITLGGALTGTSATFSSTSGTPVNVTSTAATSTFVLDNTNANLWGGVYAVKVNGVDKNYFGTLGSLLGSTNYDATVWATAGNGFRVYTNGNNRRFEIDSSGGATFTGSLTGTSATFSGKITTTTGGNGIQITGATGSPAYLSVDQSINNAGKRWRVGYTGAIAGFTSFDIYNETDNITALTLASTGAATFSSDLTTGGKILISDGGNTTVPALRIGNTSNGLSYPTANTINIITNSVTALSIASTGAATFSGALLVNNNDITQNGTRPILSLQQSGTTKAFWGISSGTSDLVNGDSSGDAVFRKPSSSGAFRFTVDGGSSSAFVLASTGAATFSGTLGINGTADNVKSGTYTPTLTNGTNVSSSSAYKSFYTRIGNIVTVMGSIVVTPTSTGNTRIDISLPIASALANNQDLAGQSTGLSGVASDGAIIADATNDRAQCLYIADAASGQTLMYSFSYEIK